jgi:hypothetical protein
MESLARFVTTFWIKSLVVSLVAMAIWTFMVVRLDLLIEPGYLLLTATSALLAGTGIVIANKFKAIGLVAGVVLFWVAIQAKAPAVAETMQVIAKAGQEEIIRAGEKISFYVPHKITCDRTTASAQVFFKTHPEHGEPEIAMWYSDEDGYIQCWDSHARHPHTAEWLKPIDAATVALIMKQSPRVERTDHFSEPRYASRQREGRTEKNSKVFVRIFDLPGNEAESAYYGSQSKVHIFDLPR